MESPITLLKSAVYETEGYSGTLQVVKACKIITDILPFDKKNFILLEDPELLKHLILSLPLNPRAIDLIIYSMLEKFQYTHTFLKQLWMAFIFVASLEESAPKRVDTHLKTGQTGSRTLRSMRSKDLDESPMPLPNKEPLYNREIERNKEIIKLTTLNYTEKVVEIYFNKIRNKVAFKPDIQLLLKLFLTYTTSEKVIVKVCTILERVKGKDQNISFDHEFEEILLSKRRLTLDLQPRVKVSSEGLTSSQKFRQGTRPEIGTTNNIIMEEKASSPVSLKVIENDSPRRMPTKEEIMTRTSGFDSDEQIDFDGEAKEYNAGAFDRWLCNCEIQDVPLISKDDEIMDLILKKENLEAFLMFLLDPRGYPISEMWKKMHNPEMDVYKEEEEMASRSIDTSNLSVKLQKIKDLKHFHPYILRSYKAMQVICDTRNFKYITQTQKDVIEMFFTNMYTICTIKESTNICNYNHLAKVTEYFLRKESHGSVHYLIRFNLLFKFLQNIGFQYVQHLFLTIFGCTEFSNDLDDEPLHNILQYCKITTFFVDLANAILSGEDTFDLDKLSVEFKPVEVEPLLRAPTESGVFSFPPEERAASYSMNFEAPFLVEETKGYHLDIDNLQSAMRAKRQTDLKKLRTMKTFLIDVKPGTGSYTERKVVKKQYPSLSEKKRHNFDENEEHEFDEIDEGEFGGEEKVDIDSGAMSARPFIKHKYSKSTTMGFESLRISPLNPKLKSPLIKGDKQKLELFNLINQQSPPVIHAAHAKSKTSMQQSPIPILANMPTGESPIPMASPHGFTTARNRGKKLSLPVIDTPSGADKDKNFHLYLASTNPKNATEPSQKGSKLNDSRKVKDSYEKMRSTSSESQMKLLRDLSDMKSPVRTKVTSDASMSEIIKDSRAPQKVTVANELKADTLNRKELKELNKLYPLSARDIIPNDMDIEAKKSEFGVENIKTTDHFALAGCEFLEELFRRAFIMPYQESKEDEDIHENDNEKKKRKKYHLKRNLGTINTDYTGLWDTIFQDDCKVFELLLKNYLIKIKMNPLGPINSGYVAGKLVNTILEKCTQKHPYIEKHTPKIIEICRKHFQYLCKMIIQSHAWLPREDFKVFLQAMQVEDLLGTGRLILVSTLNHIVHTDVPKNYDLLHQINNTCWHTLILWFFSKKTNNLYQRLFYTILETALLNTDEKFILNLLFKLNIVSNMYTTWVGMCQNHVLLKENHIDSMLYYLKKIYKLVDSIAESRDNYRLLNDQLASSISWKALQPNLLPAKRRHSTAQSLRRKSKQSTKIHLIPTGSGFNKGPRSNSDNHKSPPHTNNPTGRSTRPSIRLGSPQGPHKPGKF